MSDRVDSMLMVLAVCPPGKRAQIDESMTSKLLALVGVPSSEQATGLKDILDQSAYAALASDFAMKAMDATWKMAIEDATP